MESRYEIDKYAFEKYGVKGKIYMSKSICDFWEKQNIEWSKNMKEYKNN